MKRINMKHNYILPHFIQFKKSFFYRASPVVASRYLHYFLSLLFLTFPHFRSSHQKCSIKKIVLKVLNIQGKTSMLESLFNKVQGWRAATLLNRDSNTGVFLWIFLFPGPRNPGTRHPGPHSNMKSGTQDPLKV